MAQNRQVFYESIEETLKSNFFSRKDISVQLKKLESEIIAGHLNPYIAAQQLLNDYFKSEEK